MQNCSNKSVSQKTIGTSDFSVSFKEIFILSLFFLLLFYSIASFLHNWSKNYRGINHVPFYADYMEDQRENGKHEPTKNGKHQAIETTSNQTSASSLSLT
jgi:hypothetical protein